MTSLKKILQLLKQNYKKIVVPVPLYWFYPELDFSGKVRKVNIYDLFINYFKDFLLKPGHYKLNKNFNQSVIYSVLIRTTTVYDFDGDNILSLNNKYGLRETGTILRMFLILPLLQKMGVNILYLLPITKSSEYYKKGEASTPYSVKDFFKIDPCLYDPMLGEYSDLKCKLLFMGLVEACHKLGIKVILDFIPRTAARDSELIKTHPDWFYWIEKKYEKEFKPPFIKGISSVSFDKKYIKKIYTSKATEKFLKKFTFSPDKIDKVKWNKLLKKIKKEKREDFLNLIENEFGITTCPGFSDVINDPQSLWNEVTFVKLFLDFPEFSKKFIKKKQPPYVLFDVIKAGKSGGKKVNKPLWDFLSSVLPYWQMKFNIDGVRIDMAHALPAYLEAQIIKQAKKQNKDFIFIAEELNNQNSLKARKSGYHAIVGNLWYVEPRWEKGTLKQVIENELLKLKIPILAASETHDTPRTITRHGGNKFFIFTVVLNYFLPIQFLLLIQDMSLEKHSL